VATEGVVGVEDNLLGLVPYKELIDFLFSQFSFGFCSSDFSRSCYFDFLNSILIKNLEMDSSFFRIFVFQIFENFKFDQPIFDKPDRFFRFSTEISIHGVNPCALL
jgi:hypothetical protein